MTLSDLLSKTGVQCIREVSPTTTVVEFKEGGARPASDLEKVLWEILRGRLEP